MIEMSVVGRRSLEEMRMTAGEKRKPSNLVQMIYLMEMVGMQGMLLVLV